MVNILVFMMHYEAKLCILCIVKGFRYRSKSNLSQHCYFSLIFFAVSDSRNKYLKPCTAQNCSKIGEICEMVTEFAKSATVFAESRTVCGIHKQIIRHVYLY